MRESGHILFVAPSAYPLGGVQTWIDYVVPGLRQSGFRVTLGLVAGRYHDVDRYLHVHPIDGVVRIHSSTGSREGRVRAIRETVAQLAPDLVVGVNIPDAYPATARVRHGGQSVRAAMTVHGIQPDLFEDIAENRRVLDAVVCTNRLAAMLATELGGIGADRVMYAPYGVPALKAAAAPVQPDRVRIAFVGRLESFQKRVEDLVGIVAALDAGGAPYELVIAGSGPREAWLRAALEGPVSRGAVQFLGVVPAEVLAERVYAHADALLITSSWETGPIVAWEAMAAGVPVVTSAYVGHGLEGGLVDGENCLIFPVGDTLAAASALRRLGDSAIRQRLVRGGLNLVARRYSRQASVQAWVETCGAILCRPPLVSRREDEPRPGPAGGLDRRLGVGAAETVRRLLGRSYAHDEPGGEWPHSYGRTPETDEGFWKRAKHLDRRVLAKAAADG